MLSIMPRPRRNILTDVVYHVLNRGNRRMRIFQKPQDYEAFATCLTQGLERFGIDLFAWCLMPNHWHLVLRPRSDRQLQKFMQWLTVTHVRRYHTHHDQSTGHLYQGRYKHFCVQQDSYFLTLCRYVEANALRARLATRAERWLWSSLHQRLNKISKPPLSDWPVSRPGNWTQLANQSLDPKQLTQIREHVIRDRPLGTPDWIKKMAARLDLKQTLHPRGRPPRPIDSLSPRQRRRREAATNRRRQK
jgi:putative transposase